MRPLWQHTRNTDKWAEGKTQTTEGTYMGVENQLGALK